MAKYLVTGGCGFIGSHLTQSLIAAGHYVTILDDLSTGKESNIEGLENVGLTVADINNQHEISKLLACVDGCFHLAAIASVERSNNEWYATHQINQTGLIGLFEAISKSLKKIPVVYASSAAVYGNNEHIPSTEPSPTKPATAYGADKLACELHANVAHIVHNIPNIGLRFFNVYGPRQDASSPYSGVISIFIKQMLHNQNITIYGSGEEARDFVFVEDVVQALTSAMKALESRPEDQSGAIYNVGTGINTSIVGLADILEQIIQCDITRDFLPERRGNIRHSLADITAIEKAFGYKPTFNLHDGLSKTVAYNKNGGV